MKNDKVIASWSKIEPSDSANERMLSKILERNRSFRNGKDEKDLMDEKEDVLIAYDKKRRSRQIAVLAACLIAAVGIALAIGGADRNSTVSQTVIEGSDEDPKAVISAEKQLLTFAECMERFPYVTVAKPAGEQTSTESGGLSMQFEVIERIRGEFPESAFTLSINDTEIDYTSGEYLLFLERFENVMNGETSYAAGEIIYLDQKGLFCDSVTDISSTTLEGIISDAKAYAAEHPYKGDVVTNGEYIKSTDLQDIYAGSDCVFTAVVKEIENDSVPDRTTVLLDIREVYKGDVSKVEGITVPKHAVSVGETYLFFANRPDDTARFFIVSSQNSIYFPDEITDFIEALK